MRPGPGGGASRARQFAGRNYHMNVAPSRSLELRDLGGHRLPAPGPPCSVLAAYVLEEADFDSFRIPLAGTPRGAEGAG